MADRYWVGGTGTWDSTSTANWSASSGGATGASVPTATDNVFFDANSNVGTGSFTVTMANSPRVCNDITISGLDGTMTLAGASIGLTVSGSLSFPATNFTRSYTGTTTFNATTTGKTITTNGVAFGGNVSLNGIGGAWTLGSAFSCGVSILSLANGTFDTSTSNYAVTAGTFSSSTSNTRTINLNGSTVTLSNSWTMSTSTNATLNAGTSQITCTGSSSDFSGGGLTYYNVSFTGTTVTISTKLITGTNTFNNLSFSGPSGAGLNNVAFFANQTINGTLTVSGSNGNQRLFLRSDVFNTIRTLTCAAVSLTDVDFQDITIAGAASPATGTRLGNAINNSGITFTAAKTVYWSLAAGGNWNADAWATSSGGAPATTNYPLPQDTAIIENTGLNTSATITLNGNFNMPTMSMGTRTNAMTLANGSTSTNYYGDFTFGTGVTNTSSTSFWYFINTTPKTITGNGVSFQAIMYMNAPGGGITLGSALNCFQNINIWRGTFNTTASNYNVTCFGVLGSSSTATRTVTLNASTVSLSSNQAWDFGTPTNATINAGTSLITMNNGGAVFNGGGFTYNNVTFTGQFATTGIKAITGLNTFNNLTFSTLSDVSYNNVTISANQIINGTFTTNGSSGNCRMFFRSDTLGTSRTLTCAAIAAMTDVDFRDITIAGAAGTLSGTRLGDCGGNSNITFGAGKTVYWNLTAGGNWNANGWAASSGASPATTNYPLPQDTAIIENTGLTAGNTITINGNWNISTLDASTRTNAMTLASGTTTPAFYGNFTYGSGVTPTGTGTYTFSNRSTKTLDSGGKTFTQPVIIDAPGGGIQLLTNNLTLGSTLTTVLTQGTLDLNNLTLSTGIFSSNNSNVRGIAFGTTGSITLTTPNSGQIVLSMATATNFTFTGTSNITAAMSTLRTFNFGGTAGATDSNRLSLNLTSGSATPTFTGSFRQIDFTGSVCNPGSQTISCHGFTLASGGAYSSTSFTTVGTGTLTYTGKAILTLNINTSGITTTLGDAGQNAILTLTNGTLNLAGFTLTNTTTAATASGTKNLTFNGGTLVCSAASATAWNNAAPTNFTTTAGTGTGTISMTSASAKTFVGGGSTYNCTLNQGGAGTLTITGANTFNDITNTNATASQITFPASTTTTVNAFTLSGSSGNLVSIRSSTPGTQFTLSDASGTVSVSYLDIQDSNATGGAIWNAFTSNGNVDSGNNLGWNFSGGVVYAVSVSETATGEDAITLVLVRVGAVDETATGADTVASQFDAVGSISETATGSDAPQGNIITTKAVSETATAADAQQGNIITSRAVSETATAADAQQGNITSSNAVSETATATETNSAVADLVAYVTEGILYLQETTTLPLGTSFTGSTIFDNTSAGGGLAVVANGTGTGSSGGFAAGGNYILFSGANTRSVKTIALNLTNCPSFNFSIIRGNSSNGGETPDAGEDIVVEYSINGGTSYTTIATILNTAAITSFTTLSYTLPAGARTTSTIIRWRQSASSTSSFDQYGIRNISFGEGGATAADTQQGNIITTKAVSETATGADTADNQLDAFGGIDEAATAADDLATQLDGVANVDEIAIGVDSPLGNIITTLQISEGATILDAALARLLWELINDNQLPGWQLIPNNQGSGWTVINTNTGTSWTPIGTA